MLNADDTIQAVQNMGVLRQQEQGVSVIFVGHMGLKHVYLVQIWY